MYGHQCQDIISIIIFSVICFMYWTACSTYAWCTTVVWSFGLLAQGCSHLSCNCASVLPASPRCQHSSTPCRPVAGYLNVCKYDLEGLAIGKGNLDLAIRRILHQLIHALVRHTHTRTYTLMHTLTNACMHT